jgi:hypothetical protein
MPGQGGAALLHERMWHASIEITTDYYASVDDALRGAIRKLTWRLRQSSRLDRRTGPIELA